MFAHFREFLRDFSLLSVRCKFVRPCVRRSYVTLGGTAPPCSLARASSAFEATDYVGLVSVVRCRQTVKGLPYQVFFILINLEGIIRGAKASGRS